MARPKSSKQKTAYNREFRRRIAKLKKAGLVSSKVDARSVTPTKHYKKLVKDFESVIAGRQTTVKVSRRKISNAKELGLRTYKDRVIIDKSPGMKVRKDKRDIVGYSVTFPDKIKEIRIGGPKGETIERYFDRLESSFPDGSKGKLAFTFYGNQSRSTFESVYQARQYFFAYQTVQRAISGHYEEHAEETDVIRATTFYQITDKRVKWKGKVAAKEVPKKKGKKKKK